MTFNLKAVKFDSSFVYNIEMHCAYSEVWFKLRYWPQCHFSFFNFWFLIHTFNMKWTFGEELIFIPSSRFKLCTRRKLYLEIFECYWKYMSTTLVEKLFNNVKSTSFTNGQFLFWDMNQSCAHIFNPNPMPTDYRQTKTFFFTWNTFCLWLVRSTWRQRCKRRHSSSLSNGGGELGHGSGIVWSWGWS